MSPNASQDRKKISQQILGQEGEFPAYFRFYDDLAQRSNDFHLTIDTLPSLLSVTSDSVLLAASVLRSNLQKTKQETEGRFKNLARSDTKFQSDEKAIKMAMQAMFMVDPAAKENHSADFTLGDYRPSLWHPHQTLEDFIDRLFPPSLASSQDAARFAVEYRALRARKLQKRLGARFRLTNNLAEHLLFDERRNCLYIFHHVAFLKAHLCQYQGKENPLDIGLNESLERYAFSCALENTC